MITGQARINLPPLTLSEARAILIADKALDLSYETRLKTGLTFGIEELNAWGKLVQSANEHVVAWNKRLE